MNRAYGPYDGSLYDADLQSPNTVWQYSYSHDNAQGLMWIITVPADTNIVVRYNVSQNDHGNLLAIHSDFRSAYIYNNVFYIGADRSPTIVEEKEGVSPTYFYYNNIVYNESRTAGYVLRTAHRSFDSNAFYGQHPEGEPADLHKLTADPRLVAPGTGGLGLHTLGGYRLQPDSPCIARGRPSPGAGSRDLWGNPLPGPGGRPDCGAHEARR